MRHAGRAIELRDIARALAVFPQRFPLRSRESARARYAEEEDTWYEVEEEDAGTPEEVTGGGRCWSLLYTAVCALWHGLVLVLKALLQNPRNLEAAARLTADLARTNPCAAWAYLALLAQTAHNGYRTWSYLFGYG